MIPGPVSFLGDERQSGAYLLLLDASATILVSFGRFQGGRPVVVPSGMIAYVGSAMGKHGATALAGRLLRHATRTGGRPPHAIRPGLLDECRRTNLGPAELQPPLAKSLRWHIDYLLDEAQVEIVRIVALRTSLRLESALARQLAGKPGCVPIAAGLGAADAHGETHLLHGIEPDDLMQTMVNVMATASGGIDRTRS